MPLCVVALFRRPVGHDVSSAYSLRESRRGKGRYVKEIAAAAALTVCATGVAGSAEVESWSPNIAALTPVAASGGSGSIEDRDGTSEACTNAWRAYMICVLTSPNPEECLRPDCTVEDNGIGDAFRMMAEVRAAWFQQEEGRWME
ncbi:MAG: hypothetical protein AB7G17_04105 [Phycisphaerales bacterium]